MRIILFLMIFIGLNYSILATPSTFNKKEQTRVALKKLLQNSNISPQEKEMWNSYNNPYVFENIPLENIIEPSFAIKYTNLPKSGHMSHEPWTDTYWASYMGGIGYRWQSKVSVFNYSNHNENSIKKLSQEQINSLSPAEKFDLLQGDYNFLMTQAEKDRNNRNAQRWEGICHGWAPASLIFENSMPVRMTNPDGIQIDFNSSDIHALLSHMIAVNSNHYTPYFLGQRCYTTGSSDVSCTDANAGAFHIILTNLIERNVPIIFDIATNAEVWNQPIYGYEITSENKLNTISINAAPGTTDQVRVNLTLKYGKEKDPSYFPSTFYQSIYYSYIIDLDADGNIIGGEWLSKKRPDFLWSYGKRDFFKNETSSYYKTMEKLYKKSTDDSLKFVSKFEDYLTPGSEIFSNRHTYKVKNVLTTGDVLTQTNRFIKNSDLSVSVDKYNGFKVGDTVMQLGYRSSIEKIKKIFYSKQKIVVFLENGYSYDLKSIKRLVSNYENLGLGDTVLVKGRYYSGLATIKYLAESGNLVLSNGQFHNTKNITKITSPVNSLEGFSRNDKILYQLNGKLNSSSIVAFSADETVYLSDGNQIKLSEIIEKSINCYESFCQNENVIYLKDQKFETSLISFIGKQGNFYLNSGDVISSMNELLDKKISCSSQNKFCDSDKIIYIDDREKKIESTIYAIGSSGKIFLTNGKVLDKSSKVFKLAKSTEGIFDLPITINTKFLPNFNKDSNEVQILTVEYILDNGEVLAFESHSSYKIERILVEEYKRLKVGRRLRRSHFNRGIEGTIKYITNDGYIFVEPRRRSQDSSWYFYRELL